MEMTKQMTKRDKALSLINISLKKEREVINEAVERLSSLSYNAGQFSDVTEVIADSSFICVMLKRIADAGADEKKMEQAIRCFAFLYDIRNAGQSTWKERYLGTILNNILDKVYETDEDVEVIECKSVKRIA